MSATNSDLQTSSAASPVSTPKASNFIRDIIIADLGSNKFNGRVQTRFPPEPNGNLRFDDTNPEKEEQEYVDSIIRDVEWLGWKWDGLYYASDYFDQLYEWAIQLIKAGKAFVCDLSAEEVRQYRGSLTEPGKESPYRN